MIIRHFWRYSQVFGILNIVYCISNTTYDIIFGLELSFESWAKQCFLYFFLEIHLERFRMNYKNVKHWSSPVFQVLFGLVLICFIAFAVYHYRQKLPVVQSALSNYHPGWSPKPLLSRATLRNTFRLIVPLVTQIVTIFPYWEVATFGDLLLVILLLANRAHNQHWYRLYDEFHPGLHFRPRFKP